MPGLKGRLSTVVKSKISKQLDRAENPSETLDYAYERQVENLQNVKKGIADIVTAKKRLAVQQQQLGEQGAKLDAQAREAMSAGREDLARAALEPHYRAFRDYIGALGPADFAKKMPSGRTIGETIILFTWHEAHHQGQMHLTWNLYKQAHGVP